MTQYATFYNIKNNNNLSQMITNENSFMDEPISKYLKSTGFFKENFLLKPLDQKAPILYFQQLNNSESKFAFYETSDLLKINLLKDVYNLSVFLSSINNQYYQSKIQNECTLLKIKYEKILFPSISNFNCFKNDITRLATEIIRIYFYLINSKETLIIHSAAGTQKSNMILYCLWRINGLTKDEARVKVEVMKRFRRNSIGDYSLEFTENSIIPVLLNLYNTILLK